MVFFIYNSIFIDMKLINIYEGLISENVFVGKELIVVDVQPEYESGFGNPRHYIDFIEENFNSFKSVTFLFNGPDLGFPDENELKYWWEDNGLDYEIIEQSIFYDKGYAFFRECMVSNIEYSEIILIIQYMYANDLTDSRELEEHWDEVVRFATDKGIDIEEIKEFLSTERGYLSIPDLMDFLDSYSDVILIGGGINECLAEVEIALDALGINYITMNEYVY